jgi:putative oxidoreductase
MSSESVSLKTGHLLQRLFSTFPEGWPGLGLVILRLVAAIPPLQHGIAGLLAAPLPAHGLTILQLAAAGAAALLMVGSWTPVAGMLIAFAELCLALLQPADLWPHIWLGALAVALAMLGPGAWSVDAHRYGRKRIQIPQR